MIYDQTTSPDTWIVTIAARIYAYLKTEQQNARTVSIVDIIDYAELENMSLVKVDLAINWLNMIKVLNFDENGMVVL